VLLVSLGSFGIVGANAISLESRLKKLEAQKEIWINTQPQIYAYTIRAGCMDVFESNAKVINGVASFKEKEDNLSIEYLFTIAKRALVKSSHVEIKYHKNYGIPESISVDWSSEVIDDECGYSLVKFKAL
jgi:hypothetical protein